MKVTLPELDKHEDEIYKIPKYKPRDLILMKFKLYASEDDQTDQRFEYRYYIVLFADSNFYRLLQLKTGVGVADPLYISTYDIDAIDQQKATVLYHVDAEKIGDLVRSGAGLEELR